MNIRYILLKWYERNQRDLPWRETENPYAIWISEIILQQTRVSQGMNYYYNFLKKFPDLESLAKAETDDVLKEWQGLGYYSRARNLHFTARYIVNILDGDFPQQYDELLKLKGVGEYTAAAIASFCFNQVVAVIDGNVKRVVARLFSLENEISSKIFIESTKSLLYELIDKQNPGKFNQAIMEFGALQCVPVSPDCPSCPLKEYCMAFKKNLVKELPYKQKKTKVKKRYFYYIVAMYNNHVAYYKRDKNDIWKGLHEFPLLEFPAIKETEEVINHKQWEQLIDNQTVRIKNISKQYKHILSHQTIIARFIRIVLPEKKLDYYTDIKWTAKNDFDKLAVSRLIEKYITDIDL